MMLFYIGCVKRFGVQSQLLLRKFDLHPVCRHQYRQTIGYCDDALERRRPVEHVTYPQEIDKPPPVISWPTTWYDDYSSRSKLSATELRDVYLRLSKAKLTSSFDLFLCAIFY